MGTFKDALAKAFQNVSGKTIVSGSYETTAEMVEAFNYMYEFAVSVSKATAPADVNEVASTANQAAMSVSIEGMNIEVSAPLDDLNSYASTDESQGTAKWLGILINTGESSISGISYNGSAFSAQDIADATSVGGEAGEFVLWIKAETVAATPKTFTLTKTGKNSTVFTVTVTDTSD